ncbi:hypothetical protein TNCV_4933751 [Trichonephila clavipes]|nr:hypothetical protein TNCV_4933751 [Trichonephila clavipes]
MTSTTDWSERTDATEQQPPNSPSRMIAGDDHIAECSDLFRGDPGKECETGVDADGFAPPKQLVRKVRSPRSTPSSPTPSSAPILDSATLEEQGEEGMDTNIDVPLSQEEVPVATKAAHPAVLRLAQMIGGGWC